MHGIFGWLLEQDAFTSRQSLLDMLEVNAAQTSSYSADESAIGAGMLTGQYSHTAESESRMCRVAYAGRIVSTDEKRLSLTSEQVAARYINKGIDFLTDIEGHFSLALIDAGKNELLLASDWMGTHPCYYAETPKGLVFSSRLAGLVRHPDVQKELDPQAIYNYIYFHCVPSPNTVYRNIHKLKPGQLLRYRNGRVELFTYWTPDYNQDQNVAVSDLSSQLLNNLEKSVADLVDGRPIGAFLSGGLDSSTVTGMLARTSTEAVDTFTIGFDTADYDESAYARITAEQFSTRHHEYFVTPEDVCQVVPEIAGSYDEPFGNSSVVPTYFCAKLARDSGIQTLLAGDGGDELFAGNERYMKQKVFEYYWRLPGFLRGGLDVPYRLLPALRTIVGAQKLYSYISQAKNRLPDRLQSYNFLHRINPAKVFQSDYLRQIEAEQPLSIWRDRYNEATTDSSLHKMLYLDWKFTLADNDLMKVNTMCALAGIDVQYPMLDNRIIDLSTRLPDHVLMPDHKLRDFYKNSMQGFLSEKTLNKSKHGFGLPFGVWMKDNKNLQEIAYDNIQVLKQQLYFDSSFLDHSIDLHREGAAGYYGELIWILMMLQLWLASH